jgi:TIR domain
VRVFLSYRRDDAGGYAGRLTDALLQRLGPRSVFQDVTAISPGQDYTVAISRALADSDAALAVIGPDWLTAATPQGTPRLLEASDYVHLELARALERGIPVIPVLVGGARLPEAAELPDDLQELVQRQALELHNETWHHDVDGLVRSLRGEPAVPAHRRRRWLAAGTVLTALLALGAGAWWLWGAGTGGQAGAGGRIGSGSSAPTGSAAEVVPCERPSGQPWNRIALGRSPAAVDLSAPGYPLKFTVTDAYWRPHGGKWQVILNTTAENIGHQEATLGSWRYTSLVVAQRPNPVTCYSHTGETVLPGIIDDESVGFDVKCKPAGRIDLELQGGSIIVTPGNLDWGSC